MPVRLGGGAQKLRQSADRKGNLSLSALRDPEQASYKTSIVTQRSSLGVGSRTKNLERFISWSMCCNMRRGQKRSAEFLDVVSLINKH